MKKSIRLKPVRDLRHQQERVEARKLAELQQQLQLARQQCVELQGYLQEYFHSIGDQRQLVRQASQLALYQAFVDRLQQAIQHQMQTIKQREMVVLAQTKRWIAASEKLKSMDDLISRAQMQEQLTADKIEQKALDDRPYRSGDRFE